MLRRSLEGLLAIALVLALSPAPAQTSALAENVPVYINGDLILRLRAWDSGFSPDQRAEVFEQQVKLLFNGRLLDPNGLEIRSIRGEPAIFLDGTRLVTVTAGDARENNAEAWPLAEAWRDNLAAAIRKYNVTFDDGHRTLVVTRFPLASTNEAMLNEPMLQPMADTPPEPASTGPQMTALPTAEDAGPVMLNDMTVIRFRTGAGGFTAAERQVALEHNLKAAMDQPVARGDVLIRTINDQPTLYLGDQYLCTATAADARANGTTQRQLAAIWANNLREALDQDQQI